MRENTRSQDYAVEGSRVRTGSMTAGAFTDPGPPQDRQPMVTAATVRTRTALDELHASVRVLAERLAPVLRTEPAKESDGACSPRQCLCPLADSITDLAERAEGLRAIVDEMIRILEV